METIVVGTKNEGKIAELNTLFSDLEVAVVGLDSEISDAVEDQGNLTGNAVKKATTYAEKMGLRTISDDTGLEVEALDGAPGVKTARFAGPEATIEENKELLLNKLDGESNRQAQWRTVIAFADPNGLIETFEGVCEGKIAKDERGNGGFGYDPLFIPTDTIFEATFAEMDPKQKNAISHRRHALDQFKSYYQNYAKSLSCS